MSDHYDPRALTRLGRYDEHENACSLWWSGSGVRMTLACKEALIEAESSSDDQAPWLGILADGAPVARFPLRKGRHVYPVLCGMDPTVPHEITILRDTQPGSGETGPVLLHTLITDGVPQPSEARKKLIEFIGDSLTVGEGCTGPVTAAEWRSVFMSNTHAFPTLVTEKMKAEKRVIAVSGWGAWRSWDGQDTQRLGLIYEKLCANVTAGNIPYSFKERTADAVVINLGTNDGSAVRLAGETDQAFSGFIARAEELMAMVRAHQPHALIIWAYGLCGSEMEPYIRRAIARRREAGDGNTVYLQLSDCNGSLGALAHPSPEAHKRTADEICAFLDSVWAG